MRRRGHRPTSRGFVEALGAPMAERSGTRFEVFGAKPTEARDAIDNAFQFVSVSSSFDGREAHVDQLLEVANGLNRNAESRNLERLQRDRPDQDGLRLQRFQRRIDPGEPPPRFGNNARSPSQRFLVLARDRLYVLRQRVRRADQCRDALSIGSGDVRQVLADSLGDCSARGGAMSFDHVERGGLIVGGLAPECGRRQNGDAACRRWRRSGDLVEHAEDATNPLLFRTMKGFLEGRREPLGGDRTRAEEVRDGRVADVERGIAPADEETCIGVRAHTLFGERGLELVMELAEPRSAATVLRQRVECAVDQRTSYEHALASERHECVDEAAVLLVAVVYLERIAGTLRAEEQPHERAKVWPRA